HVPHAELPGQLDGAAQVVGVRDPLGGQRGQRVAGDGQSGQRDAPVLEDLQELGAGAVAGEQRVDVRVGCGDESAGVDLRTAEAGRGEHVERLLEGAVLEAGGVGDV